MCGWWMRIEFLIAFPAVDYSEPLFSLIHNDQGFLVSVFYRSQEAVATFPLSTTEDQLSLGLLVSVAPLSPRLALAKFDDLLRPGDLRRGCC